MIEIDNQLELFTKMLEEEFANRDKKLKEKEAYYNQVITTREKQIISFLKDRKKE